MLVASGIRCGSLPALKNRGAAGFPIATSKVKVLVPERVGRIKKTRSERMCWGEGTSSCWSSPSNGVSPRRVRITLAAARVIRTMSREWTCCSV
eukprot:scaffold15691_cov666-Ochromonas_danica.AAC.1